MDSDAASFLLSREGRVVVESLAGLLPDSLVMGRILRKNYPGLNPVFLSAAVELATARTRAGGKFIRASEMFFTREALEQASEERVAAHRAERFAGLERVCDLCCGIGGDAIALGHVAGHLTAVDNDPARVLFCRENLRIHGIPADVVEADALSFRETMAAFDGVFIDPSRRSGGRRTKRLEAMEPPLSAVEDILVRAPGGAAKLPPALDPDELGIEHELEWVSTETGLKEAVCWTGMLKRAKVTVSLVHRGMTVTDRDVPAAVPRIGEAGAFLYEPDPALIRSGLLGGRSAANGMWLIDQHIAYTSSDTLIDDPFFTGYRIVDSLPFNLKRLRDHLRNLHAGPVTVKKRGFPLEPEEILKKLALAGDRPVTIVLTRIGNRHHVFVVEPAEQ